MVGWPAIFTVRRGGGAAGAAGASAGAGGGAAGAAGAAAGGLAGWRLPAGLALQPPSSPVARRRHAIAHRGPRGRSASIAPTPHRALPDDAAWWVERTAGRGACQ